MKFPGISRFITPKSVSRTSSNIKNKISTEINKSDYDSPSSSSASCVTEFNYINVSNRGQILKLQENTELEIMEQFKEAFTQFDVDGDGKISPEEVMAVMAAIFGSPDNNITLDEARKMVSAADIDGDGFVDIQEFVQLINGARLSEISDDVSCSSGSGGSNCNNVDGAGPSDIVNIDEDLAAAFAAFDSDHDGFITAEELWRVLRQLPARGGGAECSLEDCRLMISRVDRKGIGRVDFEDFALMMAMK